MTMKRDTMEMITKNKFERKLFCVLLIITLLITSCSNEKKVHLEQLESRWQTLQIQKAEYGIEKQSIIEYQDFLKDFPENHKYGNQHASEAKEYIEKIKSIQDSILKAEIKQLKNDSLKQLRYDFYSATIENDYTDNYCFNGDDSDNENSIQIYGTTFSQFYCDLADMAYNFPNLYGCAKVFARKNNIPVEKDKQYSALEAMAGVSLYTHNPKDTNYEFSYINPEIVKWAHQTLIPIPQNQFYNYSYQKIYNKVFRSKMRLYALTHYHLHNITKAQQIVSTFKEELNKDDSWAPQSFVNKQFSDFNINGSMINPDAKDNYKWSRGDEFGFWIRRMVDGSADELWKGLEKVLSLYDNEWKESMLSNPKSYLKVIDWIPENVITNNKERTFTIKKDSLYMISESKYLWKKPDILSRRTDYIRDNQIIRVDSIGESFNHNGEKLHWIKIDKRFADYTDSITEGWIPDAFLNRQVFNCTQVKNCSLKVEFDTTSTKTKVSFKLLNPTELPITITQPSFVFKYSYKNSQRSRNISYKNMIHFPAKKETLLASIDVRRKKISSNKYEYIFRDNSKDKSAKFRIPKDESWSLKTSVRFKINNIEYNLNDTTLTLW